MGQEEYKVDIHKLVQIYSNFFKDKGYSFKKRNSLISPFFPDTFNPSAAHLQIRNIITGEENLPSLPKFFLIDPCFRHIDIEKVGYSFYHLSLFEMAASVYLVEKNKTLEAKEKIIKEAWEFLVKELGLDPDKLVVTIFGGWQIGSLSFERDYESFHICETLGFPKERIIYIPGERNFTYLKNENEPAGPRCEIYFDRGNKYGDIYRYIELGTIIFESYKFDKKAPNKLIPLENKIYGSAWGIERLSLILEGKDTIFQTTGVFPLINIINAYIKDKRQSVLFPSQINLIADHIRSIVFIICDGQLPDNSKRGQRLRKLIKAFVSNSKALCNRDTVLYEDLIDTLIEIYKPRYPELSLARDEILNIIKNYT